ncbi:NAD(P)/FAD-dependent oxidoreductase [Promicromonospora thailandica]|uniref:Dehydrogenase (Flavoprotein) n=1 Tax=Promicromonospora thailandica TaxID=765201 RepID=A0A9X2JYC4_9MICO|nr:FAD-dependent monooxygenase [Promicromonospora thailandica]MCP2267048.1 Dehydrogenase (flavoprotein) [Promicromonospora thailandica]BFF16672.1 NAD(P)/FAD-dependent oxidoreductase [Promicromonospora thailandica]
MTPAHPGDLDADVVVVGAGPVGLAAAVRARQAGLRVLVVERRSGTLDKACGEGLLPGALRAVRELGADPPGHPLAGISYRGGGRHADHRFAAGPGRGVRRTALHAALAVRAADAGAPVLHARTTALRQDAAGVEVDVLPGDPGDGARATTLRAAWVLGCDGLHSTVRRLAGLEPGRPAGRSRGGAAGRRYGLRRHFEVAPWSDLVEVHWSPRAEAYVTPVGPDRVGVALLGPGPVLREGAGFDALLRGELPELAERLAAASDAGPLLGAGPLRRRSRRRTAGRVRLVGDASGYVDALTGEGIRVGLAQAEAAVAHLDDAAAYERAWRAATRDYRALTTGLLTWASSPARGAIVPAAAGAPWLYGAVVERLAR